MATSRTTFSTRAVIRFRDADPAGVMFFGNVFGIAHDAYEEFIRHLGFEWNEWFAHPEWAVPIRQSSCEYFMPMRPAEVYVILVFVDRIGESSFTLRYAFEAKGRKHCEVSLVHTFLNKQTRTKMPVPSDVRDRLEAYQRQS